MKIAAKTEISPHEEALIQDFIKQMKQEHPNLELSMNDIYDSALRTGIDAVLEQIRTDRRQKIMEDWMRAVWKGFARQTRKGAVSWRKRTTGWD